MINAIQVLVLERIVTVSGQENLPYLLEWLQGRPVVSALLDELKTLTTKVEGSKIDYVVGASSATL